MSRHRLHVLIPGSRTVMVTPDGDRHSTQAVVALDRAGRLQFGSEAIAHAARPDGVKLVSPYTTTRVDSVHLAAAHLDWLVARAGGRRSAAAVVVPASPRTTPEHWAAVVSRMTCPAVMVSRPVAAASGLGLGPGAARMVIDRRDDGVEVSAVAEDGVIATEHRHRSTVADVVAATHAVFARVDPDLEWTIRQDGVDALTDGYDRGWSAALAASLGLAVQVVDDPVTLLHAGVKADLAVIERCLTTAKSRAGRLHTTFAT